MLTTAIPKNVAAEEASFRKDPVIIVEPHAKSSIAYRQLAEELMERNISVGSEQIQSFADTEYLEEL
jgi:cellulose biosynthesis protein BcsQ